MERKGIMTSGVERLLASRVPIKSGRVGFVSVGHYYYWPQFPGVEEKLLEHLYPGTCPRCNTKLRLVNSQRRLFLCCPNMLEKGCTIQRNVQKRLIQKGVTALKLKCEECANGHMVYRKGKRGPFLGCNQYSTGQCKSTYDFNDYISHANNTMTKDAS